MAPRFTVDFNELLASDLVMLSQLDSRKDIAGDIVPLIQGLRIEVQEENRYADGVHEILFARGVVEANTTGTWTHVKWLCRIDSAGITDIGGK